MSKLILVHKPFKLEKLEPGDCVINFSMQKLINHRNDINKMLHHRIKDKVNVTESRRNNKK